MGPYCKFCRGRCFVHMDRWPEHIRQAYGYPNKATIAATCRPGQRAERELTGYSYDDVKGQASIYPQTYSFRASH